MSCCTTSGFYWILPVNHSTALVWAHLLLNLIIVELSEIYEFDWYSAVTSNCWQFSLKLLNNSATDNWQLTTVCPTISNYSTPNIIMIILSSKETCLLVWCSVQTYIYNCIVFSNPLLSLSIVHCALTVEIQVFLFRLFLETRIVPARFVARRRSLFVIC